MRMNACLFVVFLCAAGIMSATPNWKSFSQVEDGVISPVYTCKHAAGCERQGNDDKWRKFSKFGVLLSGSFAQGLKQGWVTNDNVQDFKIVAVRKDDGWEYKIAGFPEANITSPVILEQKVIDDISTGAGNNLLLDVRRDEDAERLLYSFFLVIPDTRPELCWNRFPSSAETIAPDQVPPVAAGQAIYSRDCVKTKSGSTYGFVELFQFVPTAVKH